jgi:ABC-2 type transport system permease protein
MNSLIDSLPLVPRAPQLGMSRSRLLRAYLIDTKCEFIRMLRSPPFLIPVLVISPVMYLLFGVAFINSLDQKTLVDITRMDLLKLMFVNFSVFSILAPSMVSLGTLLATERDSGLLTLRRALPVPAQGPLIAKTLFALLVILTLMLVLTVEAVLCGKLEFTWVQYATIWAVCIGGALPFAAIGLYMGASLSGTAANGLVTAAYMSMAMVGGLLFPLPPGFAWIALFSPPFYLSQLAFGAAGMKTILGPTLPVILLASITVLFGWLAARRLMRAS